jgi:hypothetical protein
MSEKRRRKFLLDTDFGVRETFADACEAYSRLLALGRTRVERQEALAAHVDGPLSGGNAVDTKEYLGILRGSGRGEKRLKTHLAALCPAQIAPPNDRWLDDVCSGTGARPCRPC